MTIIVTGAAGFIGANIVKGLNARGETDIIAVDNLTRADKFKNIVDCQISDYLDKTEFVERFARGDFGKVRAIFHEGACSDTMETDGRYMMDNNYRYTLAVMRACLDQGVQFLYASSAATYGASETFREEPEFERPLNVYGYSKLLFDQVVRRVHNFNQFRAEGTVKLFGEYNGYPQGGQMRDFVSVEDVVKVNLFFFDHPDKSGIFNLGTGRAQPFNDIATTVVNTLRGAEGKPVLSTEELAQEGLIEYVKFPDALRGKYQCFTQADQSRLRAAGYTAPFLTVQEGVERYCQWLLKQPA